MLWELSLSSSSLPLSNDVTCLFVYLNLFENMYYPVSILYHSYSQTNMFSLGKFLKTWLLYRKALELPNFWIIKLYRLKVSFSPATVDWYDYIALLILFLFITRATAFIEPQPHHSNRSLVSAPLPSCWSLLSPYQLALETEDIVLFLKPRVYLVISHSENVSGSYG